MALQCAGGQVATTQGIIRRAVEKAMPLIGHRVTAQAASSVSSQALGHKLSLSPYASSWEREQCPFLLGIIASGVGRPVRFPPKVLCVVPTSVGCNA
eukprot:5702795-Amphidinium_carterae.1